jgi:hypothetical protein
MSTAIVVLVVLFLGLVVGYVLITRRTGKKVTEIKPKDALTAAFKIGQGGLEGLDDDDDDEVTTPDPPPVSAPPPSPEPAAPSYTGAWVPAAYLDGSYTAEQAEALTYEDLPEEGPEPPAWRAKRHNQGVGDYATLHVPYLQKIRGGEMRRLFAVYGVPVGWGKSDADGPEFHRRFQEIDEARESGSDWEAYLRQTWGLINQEHHDFIRSRLFPGWEQQAVMDERRAEVDGQRKAMMDDNVAAQQASGELDPVEGVSLEQWAAAQAALSQGSTAAEQCGALGIDEAAWERVSAEWNARMARDKTATIATVYGNAFAGAGQGQFGASTAGLAPGHANPGQAPNTGEPFPMETWIEVQEAVNAATARGEDTQDVLASFGMTAADWGPASGWWAMKFASESHILMGDYSRLSQKYQRKYGASDDD